MNPGGMSGVGRRLASQYRRLASNPGHRSMAVHPSRSVEVKHKVLGTVPKLAPNGGMAMDTLTAGQLQNNVPEVNCLSLGTTSGSPLCKTVASSLPSQQMAVHPSRSVEVKHKVLGTVPKLAPNGGMAMDTLTAGQLQNNVPEVSCLSLGTTSGSPLCKTVASSLPSQQKTTFSMMKLRNEGSNPNARQHTFGTLAGLTVGFSTSTGDHSGNDQAIGIHVRGNAQELCQRISIQTHEMKTKILGFEARYMKHIRSRLSSRCLIVPNGAGLKDPWTAFLHNQIFKIAGHNASYLSCFDIMSYESVKNDDDEFERFLDHLVDKKIHVIEDWLSSLSTVEILMYDHGLKQPDDGTSEPFFKGECDAAYDSKTGIASLSYIIWKDDKIVYSEIFSSIKCSSAVEAEIFAACALLHKAEELKINKLLVCSDSRTVATILSGELLIGMKHLQRDLFLMLRAMRSRFKWLVATWKPRELMVFADDLARIAKLSTTDSAEPYIRITSAKWSDHLRGFPVFRVERSPSTNTAAKKLGKVRLADSYGMHGESLYFVEVDEDMKLDCLVGLTQRLQPKTMSVFVSNYDQKAESFKRQFETGYAFEKTFSDSGLHSMFMSTCIKHTCQAKRLIVSFDYTVPKHVYYRRDAFHVVLVTPSERKIMGDKIPELSALGYVYFNGVRFPLNDPEEEQNKKK